MRSKPKARRSVVHQDGLEDMRLSADPDAYDEAADEFQIRPLVIEPADVMDDPADAPEPEINDDEDDDEDEHPVYIPEDIHIPEEFELRESTVFAGLGVWTVEPAEKGEKFGPFEGKMRNVVENPTSAWELVDEFGKVKGWIDASQPGTGNWLKYVRSSSDPGRQNLMAVQLQDQVFYKAVRDIEASEELLLYEQDAVCTEPDADSTANYQEERQFPCDRCREVFRSKVALRRHETYVCNNKNAIFTTINRGFKDSMQQLQQRLQLRFQQQQMEQQMEQEQMEVQEKQQQHVSMKGLEESDKLERLRQEPSIPSQQGQKQEQLLDSSLNAMEKKSNGSGQSEEMIQTGAADDHSALGSPSTDTQPYSIIDSVTGLRTFPCENCDKQFTDPSNLQRHIRSQHHGARSHACPECGKTFATSSGLKQHQHIHSSVKPFQCEVCLKAYTQFSNLCRHKRMHADCRQQIKCKDCGQAFSTMTSLSKHKRFCEGMLRPNGAQRIAYPGLAAAAAAAAADKTASGLSLMNAASQNPTSALASAYMNVYGPRPPFPFYPPFGAGGTGFPMFPSGHPMAGMAPPVMPADGGKLGGPGGGVGLLHGGGSHRSAPTSPGSHHSLHGQTGELKREKNASEGSEADSSDVSSASDLDTSTGSDVDSEFGLSRHSKMERSALRAHLSGGLPHHGVQVVNSHTRLAKSPLSAAPLPPPAAHNLSLNSSSTSSKDTNANSKHSEDDDVPFDLSKSSPSTPVSFTSSGDQPLDLSVRAKDVAVTPETTPRKTHIFGSGSSEGKRTPTSSMTTTTSSTSLSATSQPPRSTSSPDTPPSPINITPTNERNLHYAYPISSPVVMEPMYRVDKEKPHSYQDVVARMMAFGPRLPMHHHSPMNFGGLSAGGMGLLSPSRPDAAKLLPPMLGKGPDHFQYSSTVNKLKERYACKFCGKIFPRSANLTRHLRTHTGEQPYKCKYCERSFSISSNLQRHVRNIHNKEKPFKCPLCDRCFGQQTNLDRHLKKHESDDPNMLDSPLQQDQELEEKDDSYFDEIRNFIGKATADGGGSGGEEGGSSAPSPGGGINGIAASLLAAKESRNAAAAAAAAESGLVDSAFSLTGQQVVEKQRSPLTTGEKRPAAAIDDDDDDIDDVVDDEEEDDDEVLRSSAAKKARVDNNNLEHPEDTKASNGFHTVEEDEEEEEEDAEEEEEEGENGSSLNNGLNEVNKINSVKAPLVCSS